MALVPRTLSLIVPELSQSGQPPWGDSLDVRWFRSRSQTLVLRTVQMRVSVVDPDLEDLEDPATPDAMDATPFPGRTTLVPEVSDGSAAPPLAVRPVEDPDWVMRN
jgi:hypothetical protein